MHTYNTSHGEKEYSHWWNTYYNESTGIRPYTPPLYINLYTPYVVLVLYTGGFY
jgi:hypothetical protein